MIPTRIAGAWPGLLGAAIIAVLGNGAVCAQAAQAADPVTEVRRTVADARKDITAYTTAGGVPGASDHPALKWEAELWAYRERYPRSEAATIASTEAVRLLIRAELWDGAHARVDSLDADDPAWERMPAAIYEEGIARKDLPSSIERIAKVVAATTNPQIKSAALVVLGRAYRRHGDNAAASRSLEAAKAAAPGTSYAKEADGLLYEIKHLSIGLQAPPISGEARSGRAVSLSGFRGKAVVLVFWGTT